MLGLYQCNQGNVFPTHSLSTLYRKVPDSRRSKPKPKPKLPARPPPAEYYDDYYYGEPVKRQGYGGEYLDTDSIVQESLLCSAAARPPHHHNE